METVYTLCNVDRGVPEVWGSVFDVRDLLTATVKLADGKTLEQARPQGSAQEDQGHGCREAAQGDGRALIARTVAPAGMHG